MRPGAFTFRRNRLRRLALGLFAGLACTAAAHAQAGFTFKYVPRALGAADIFGYAIWSVPLGELALNGQTVPLRADFTTDPRPPLAPGPLGRAWNVPFFASVLAEEGQDTLRWLRPDGRVFHLTRERGNTTAKATRPSAPLEFTSTEASWRALKEPKSRRYLLTHKESGAELVYEDGLLTRFAFVRPAEGGESYTITYNHLRRPARLAVLGSGKVLAEFIYEDARRAKELRLGDIKDLGQKTISFEYADAALNQFAAGPYLSKIGDAVPNPLAITYQAEGGDANRVRFERLISGGGHTGLLWDAHSGFIREDDGATYKIENPSLANAGRPLVDPKAAKAADIVEDKKKPAPVADYNWRPEEAKVTRMDREGKSEFRYYDRAKGIATLTNKEGVSTVTYYLLTPGAMMHKVRKVEEVRGNAITVLERNAYDELGRLVRKINQVGAVSIWEYLNEGQLVRKITDGQINQELHYDQENRLLKNRLYNPAGFEEYQYIYSGTLETVKFIVNDSEVWTKLYEKGKGILEYTKASGEKYTWSYLTQNGLKIISQTNPDGSISQLKN